MLLVREYMNGVQARALPTTVGVPLVFTTPYIIKLGYLAWPSKMREPHVLYVAVTFGSF